MSLVQVDEFVSVLEPIVKILSALQTKAGGDLSPTWWGNNLAVGDVIPAASQIEAAAWDTFISPKLGRSWSEVSPWISPLSTVAEKTAFDWPFVHDWSKSATASSGAVTFLADVSAEAAAKWVVKPGDASVSNSGGKAGLSLSINGGLKGSTSASFPIPHGSGKIAVSAGADMLLTHFLEFSESKLLAEAAGAALNILVTKWDLDSISDVFSKGVLKKIEIATNYQSSVDCGLSFGVSGTVFGRTAGSVGVNVKAAIVSSAPSKIVIIPSGGKVNLKINRATDRASSLGIDIGVVLDLADLAAKAKKMFDGYFGRYQKIIDEFEKSSSAKLLLTPGTFIEENIKGVIEAQVKDVTVKGMLNNTLGLTSAGDPKAELKKLLVDRLNFSEKIWDSSESAIGDLKTSIIERWPLFKEQTEKLNEIATQVVSEFRTAADAEIAKLFDSGYSVFAPLFESAHLDIPKLAKEADDRLAGFRSVIEDVLGKYQKFMSAFEAAASSSAKSKFEATVSLRSSISSHDELEFEVELSPGDAAAKAAFGHLLSGSIGEVWKAAKNSSTTVNVKSGRLKQVAKDVESSKAKFVLFGMELLSLESVMTGECIWDEDVNGNIQVMARGTLKKSFENFFTKERKDLSLIQLAEIVGSKSAGMNVSPSFSFSFDYMDQYMEQHEAEDVLNKLKDAGLLSAGKHDEADAAYKALFLLNKARPMAAKLSFGFSLNVEEIERLFQIKLTPGAKGYDASSIIGGFDNKKVATQIIDSYVPYSRGLSQSLRANGSMEKALRKLYAPPGSLYEMMAWAACTDGGRRAMRGEFRDAKANFRRAGGSLFDDIWSFVRAIDNLRSVVLSTPGHGAWSPANYRNLEASINSDLNVWMWVVDTASVGRSELASATISALDAIAKLSCFDSNRATVKIVKMD